MKPISAKPTSQVSGRERRYISFQPLGGQQARVLFPGRFLGRPVIWDATLFTLAQCYRGWLAETGDVPGAVLRLRQFIEVGSEPEPPITLRIGLRVSAIDEPTVLKTIIMIQNYKRLRRGRHEYGEEYCFPAG